MAMGNPSEPWTLDQMSERYLRGGSVALTRAFAWVGQKWELPGEEVCACFYVCVRGDEAKYGETRSSELEWAARVRGWGRQPRTRSIFLTMLGNKRKEAEVRDELGFETIEDARAHLAHEAYDGFSATQHVDYAGMRVSVSDARDLLLERAARYMATHDLTDADRRGVAAAVLKIDGWTDEEVAVAFGMKVPSLRTYRSRGKKLLTQALRWGDAPA